MESRFPGPIHQDGERQTGKRCAMSTLLVTGFPGFLASSMIPRILAQRPDDDVVCLVESRFLDLAKTRVAGYNQALAPRIKVLAGDITTPGLGVDGEGLNPSEIFHFAAIYDLMVPRPLGMKINVEGTRNVLRFAEGCSNLEFLHYVSTCYVSGRYTGPYRETDLDRGQRFNNFYEETKFLAEVEVQRSAVPWIVYRPAIVVGDSKTGATLKYDGPYPVIRWLLRQFSLAALMPALGDPSCYRINLVPQDFVLEALCHLSLHGREKGRVYHLADPNPLTVGEMVAELGRNTGRHVINLPLPLGPTRMLMANFPALCKWTGFTPAMLDYFVHPTHYMADATTAALAGSGVTCPDIRQVLPSLVSYVRAHPEPAG